jgi:hypothetical protein
MLLLMELLVCVRLLLLLVCVPLELLVCAAA